MHSVFFQFSLGSETRNCYKIHIFIHNSLYKAEKWRKEKKNGKEKVRSLLSNVARCFSVLF